MFNYECDEIKTIIDEVSPNYPQLTTYTKEWLFFNKYHYIPGIPVDLEYQLIEGEWLQTAYNVIPFIYKRVILNGITKYRDIDTGDILDTFDASKNLELISAKKPVLTKTGKNLFDGEMVQGWISDSNGMLNNSYTAGISSANFTPVKPNTKYKLSFSDNPSDAVVTFYYYDHQKKYIGNVSKYTSFTPPDNAKYVRFRLYNIDGVLLSDYNNVQFQIEENSIATSYEPYHSDIITTSEEVLRGFSNVKDELNVMTGEFTQHIAEIELNGSDSENWSLTAPAYQPTNGNFVNFDLALKTIKPSFPIMCNNIPVRGWSDSSVNLQSRSISGHSTNTILRLCIEKSIASDVNSLRAYLKLNPSTIQYRLATPVIKTYSVSINKPYDGTNHYHAYSDTISPIILIEVPVVSTGNKTLLDIQNQD